MSDLEPLVTIQGGNVVPMVPWRDPHTVSPDDLSAYIQKLERACVETPRSADLRTCLGMAYAVNGNDQITLCEA